MVTYFFLFILIVFIVSFFPFGTLYKSLRIDIQMHSYREEFVFSLTKIWGLYPKFDGLKLMFDLMFSGQHNSCEWRL